MQRLVVVDVETTGLSSRHGGRVIEVGALALEQGATVAEFHSLIDCATPITAGARRVHGISAHMLRGQPPPQQVWPAFHAFIGHSPLIAHNAPFDVDFLAAELARLGLGLDNSAYCTLRLSRQLLPRLANHKLDTVYQHLCGAPETGMTRHRALGDARMTTRVWLALEKEAGRSGFRYQGEYKIRPNGRLNGKP